MEVEAVAAAVSLRRVEGGEQTGGGILMLGMGANLLSLHGSLVLDMLDLSFEKYQIL